MKAREIMTPDVCTVGPETAVEAIAKLLVERGISAVPVVNAAGGVVGMVSEADLLRRRELGTDKRRHGWRRWLADPDTMARDYAKSRAMKAADVMVAPVVSADPDAMVAEIAGLIERYDVNRVPVIDGERLVGIVSRADLVRALARSLPGVAKRASDAEIRDAMQQRLQAQPWTSGALVSIAVEDRAVVITGLVGSEEQSQAIRVMAESIPGVASVNCKLQLRPPLTL